MRTHPGHRGPEPEDGPGCCGPGADGEVHEGAQASATTPAATAGTPTHDTTPRATTPRGTHTTTASRATVSRTRLTWALGITLVVLAAEVAGSLLTGSLALAADAGHMLVDSSGLVIALVATHLMTRPRDDRHTWGWARSEVIAAALQAGMLAVICLSIAVESVRRLVGTTPVDAAPMLAVGVLGLLANAASLAVLAGGRTESLTLRAAFLEVASDALGSLAVVLAALATLATGWQRADAVASLVIAAVMAPRAAHLLRRSARILMEETPEDLDLAEVRAHMGAVPGVIDVHDLHVSTIASGVVQLSAHVTVAEETTGPRRRDIVHALQECAALHFPVAVGHSTFQLDTPAHREHETLTH